MDVEFTEIEKLIGHVATASGSLIIADGAIQSSLRLAANEIVHLDVDQEQRSLPVYAVKQNNKRFLLIAVDDGTPIHMSLTDKVLVSEPAEVPDAQESDTEESVEELGAPRE